MMRPTSALLVGAIKLLVGAYARRIGTGPSATQRIYFANHTSHIDTLAIWSSLPGPLRRRTRPIAARDYWGKGLRKYIATRGFGALLIDRARANPEADPLEPLRGALRGGDSLIIFPEGTRTPPWKFASSAMNPRIQPPVAPLKTFTWAVEVPRASAPVMSSMPSPSISPLATNTPPVKVSA